METRDYHSKNTDYWPDIQVTIEIITMHKRISNHIRSTADTTSETPAGTVKATSSSCPYLCTTSKTACWAEPGKLHWWWAYPSSPYFSAAETASSTPCSSCVGGVEMTRVHLQELVDIHKANRDRGANTSYLSGLSNSIRETADTFWAVTQN